MSKLSCSTKSVMLLVLYTTISFIFLSLIRLNNLTTTATRWFRIVFITGLLSVCLPAQAQSEWVGWPSGDERDGRFLAVTGPLSAIDYVAPNIIIGIPGDATQFDIELFDGDASANLSSKYDINVSTAGYTYTLFADPNRDGAGGIVELTRTDADFTNDAWSSYVTNHPVKQAAQGEGGFYWYRLSLDFNGNPDTEQFFNALKVRVRSDVPDTPVSVSAFKEVIIGSSPFNPILDPGLASPDNTYDGDWDFDVKVTAAAIPPINFSDADADFAGDVSSPGLPPDDNFARPDFRISPSIRYELFAPSGELITLNTDPSGTEEEETFSYNPPVAVPPGSYRWHWFGVDASNVFIIRTNFELFPVNENQPTALGNFVWLDENADGLQDAGEPGIAGVVVLLKDAIGDVLGTQVTDSNGGYLFDKLDPGMYTVEIDPSSLPFGAIQTSNPVLGGADFGNQSLPYVVNLALGDVNLTADFGFNFGDPNGNQGLGSLGDKVWIDTNGNGRLDAGEAGLGGVELTLYTDSNGDGVIEPGVDSAFSAAVDSQGTTGSGMTVTAADGSYLFDQLPADAYVVVVNPLSLPAGFVQTGDPDEFAEPASAPDNQTTSPVVLAPGDVFLNVDFGYRPDTAVVNMIGDTVFLDINTNGVEDAGEPGIADVTVSLLNVFDEPIASMTTDSNGMYLFDGLPDGDYSVVVTDTNGILAALSQSADPDATLDARSSISVAGGETNLDQDFGYNADSHGPDDGLLGDTVFIDRNANGSPDSGEGLGSVKVQLYDVTGTALLAETITNADGLYLFGGLTISSKATYTVKVDTSTVPAGLMNTVDPDGGNNSESSINFLADPDGSIDGINLDQDFGYVIDTVNQTPGTIGDTVWLDANADGVNDGALGSDGIAGTADDEPGIEGVTLDVYLDSNGDGELQAGEPRLGRTVTDSSGAYLFDQLLAGDYIVDVSDDTGLLNGYWHSLGQADSNDQSQSDPYAVSLPDGGAIVTADFGYYVELASVGDFVWFDSNANGIQESDEPGIPGVGVELTISYPDGSQSVLGTVTVAGGLYSFTNLLGDEDYNGYGTDGSDEPLLTITVAAPGGLVSSPADQGGDDAVDSDNGQGELAEPVMGGMDASNDFGFYDLGSISGNVSEDIDRDGTVEGPLAGVTVILYGDANQDGAADDLNGDGSVNVADEVARDATDTAGNYQFTDLSPGNYLVLEVDPDGYESVLDNDVTADVPADGIEIANSNPADNLLPVSLVVDVVQLKVEDDDGNNFVDSPTIAAGLGDRVWYDYNANGVQDASENGIENVTVNLKDDNGSVIDTMVTDGNGFYQFSGLLAGEYTVEVDSGTLGSALQQTYDLDDGASTSPATPNAATVALGAGESNNDVDFGYWPLGSLGDTVWNDDNANGVLDAGESGIAGVTVTLTGPVVATTATDADGVYGFMRLPIGSYTVTVSGMALDGLEQTHDLDDPVTVTPVTANTADVDLVLTAAGDEIVSRDDVDFGYREQAAPGSISGAVLDADLPAGSNGINGVKITLYEDTNKDGVLSDDEVNSQLAAPTTTTGADGSMGFDPVVPGNYFLVEEDPAGYDVDVSDSDTTPEDGIDGNTPVDNIIPVIVDPGEADNDNVFVERRTGSIGDTVWNDLNGNGIQESNEPGIDGVTVTLFDSSGAEIASQVTASGGQYLFEGILAGTYTVSVSGTPINGLSQTYDLDDGTGPFATANASAVTLGLDEDKRDVDFGFMQLGSISGSVLEDSTGDSVGDRALLDNGGQPVTVMLELFAADASGNPLGQALALTTANPSTGAYQFIGLLPGDYVVLETQPGGFTSIADNDASADGDSFDADTTVDERIAVTLMPGEIEDDGNNFVEQRLASISGWVAVDTDGDKNGDSPLADVTLTLLDAAGNTIATTTTAKKGWYSFTGLQPGEYTVVETQPAGYISVKDQDENTADAGDPDPQDSDTAVDDEIGVNLIPGETDKGNNFVEAASQTCPTLIDFDTSADGQALAAGTIIDDEFSAYGITVSTSSAANPAMIFDSANPTGGDRDLGTPNQDFGGPGIGSGGASGAAGENSIAEGNLLIISEDGDQTDPDDNAAGGTLIFEFATPYKVASVTLIDIESATEDYMIRTYDANGVLITSAATQGLGNNSRVVVDVNADRVSRLEIVMSGSGGVANLDIVCADDPSIDIRKQAEGYDVRTFSPGDTVDFEIQVTNTGAVDLSSVVVSDPQLAACDNTIGFLAAGQSVTYTCSTVLDSGSSAAKVWLDNFSPAYSYAGNDGNTNFAGNWTENDPQGGGASSGRVVVGSNEKLWMNNYGYPGGNNFKPSVQRGVDLSGMETATLSFDWVTHSGVDESDAVALEVSTDGGSSFTEISKFWGRNTSGRHESFDVSGYISSQTVFRFRVTNYYGGGDETFKVDNFKIKATSKSVAEGYINVATVSGIADEVTVTDSDPSEVVVDEPLCDVCVDGQRQITLKVSDWSSSRDQGETVRVREGGLGGALLFEGLVSNGGSFTFDVTNPGVTIVVTVQGYHHPDEYVKAAFVSDCDLMVNDTSGNSYITLEVTELLKDGADGNCNNLPADAQVLNVSNFREQYS